ncbi:MAG: histidinol-phosphatase [Gammaproteobacteria bacterium AqS3]|nr:histidinol-phosphatase [Gammaproteobacteria bacterium AqS3]
MSARPDDALLHEQVPKMLAHAGAIALRFYRSGNLDLHNKEEDPALDYDPVTAADIDIEQYIRGALAELTPHYGFSGEESGGEISPGYCWILDPIDGTRSFVAGVPVWGTLLGLLLDGAPQFGWCLQPFTDELYYGDGTVSTLRHSGTTRTLRVSGEGRLERACMASTYPQGLDAFCGGAEGDWARLDQAVRINRFGTDCYGYCMVACGQLDIQIDGNLKPFDILPLAPIVRGAGGVLTDRFGNEELNHHTAIAAASPQLHEAVLHFLDSA